MTKTQVAQKLTYLVNEFAEVYRSDADFTNDSIVIRKKDALKMLDKVIELVNEYQKSSFMGTE